MSVSLVSLLEKGWGLPAETSLVYTNAGVSELQKKYYYYYYYFTKKDSMRLEVVEWSEQLRSVTSVSLGAAAAAFKSDSAPAGVRARKMFGNISPPRDLLPSIIIIIIFIFIYLFF